MLDAFFDQQPESRAIFDTLQAVIQANGPVEVKISKSQVAFCAPKAFAWAWMPGQYLRRKAAPLVLSLSLPYRDSSPRWKQVVETRPGKFMHHLELYSPAALDAQVTDWIKVARENQAPPFMA